MHLVDILASDLGKVVGDILDDSDSALMTEPVDESVATKIVSLRAAIRQNKRAIAALSQRAGVATTRSSPWPDRLAICRAMRFGAVADDVG